jgi:hypothetical protein
LYLSLYPPSQSASVDTTIALSQQRPGSGGGAPPPQKASGPSFVGDNRLPGAEPPGRGTELQTVVVLSTVAAFVVLLMAGGLGFTMHEFQRLSAGTQFRSLAVKTKPTGRTEDATASFQRVS